MRIVFPQDGGIYQQDIAECHTTDSVRAWFKEHQDQFIVLPCPENSPDLNPINNLWNHLDRVVRTMDSHALSITKYFPQKIRLGPEERRHPRSDQSNSPIGTVYFQVDDHVDPGKCPAAVSSEKKKQELLHMEFYHHLPSWVMNEQMSYFSSFSDEWSRDLKTTKEIPVVFKHRWLCS
ncbi:transposable element Tcb1 transposase [Trichonephila clavipes]|nr:transposable element Tcb1 transposase [Trichonephila clavipes]